MGTGSSIEKRHSTSVPVTPRRQTQRQEGVNAQQTTETKRTPRASFRSTIDDLPDHAKGTTRTGSDWSVHLLTDEEKSRLGPPLPRRKEAVFGELSDSPPEMGKMKFTFEVTGIEKKDPLARAIFLRLPYELS